MKRPLDAVSRTTTKSKVGQHDFVAMPRPAIPPGSPRPQRKPHDVTGNTPRRFDDDARVTSWFRRRMFAKLRANSYKGGWERCSSAWLLNRLRQETTELQHALVRGKTEAIIDEAADVANFTMMIAANVSGNQ